MQATLLTKNKHKSRCYTKSSSFVMALLFTILCGAVALTLGYFINYFAKGHFVHSTQAIIDSEIRYLKLLKTVPQAPEGRLYLPVDQRGHLPQAYQQPDKQIVEGLLLVNTPKDNRHYAARIHTLTDGRKILVGTDITDMADDFTFMQWIGIASIGFVMIVVFVSYIISIFVVNGTNKITETAYNIMHTGDLSQRIDVHSRWDDLSNVATILNLLLDRIENLMQGVKQVSDNITHDLRTPLTRMRSHIENSSHIDREKLLQETDEILTTFNALLRISRLETEQKRSQFTDIALDCIIQDVLDFYEPLAQDKRITISTNISPVALNGDRDLLFQAFANILDNAIKYTPCNGEIDVAILEQNANACIIVENTCDAIDEQDLPKLFDRFYRTDKSRNKTGTGLGLSLVSAIIQLHNGHVHAENTPNGVRIITYL